MVKVTYEQPDGSRQTLDLAAGSVMQGAVAHDIPGIRAECGGACACATCMVMVDEEWQARLPKPGPMELSMLDGEDAVAEGRQARLSCQIAVTPDIDGVVVHVPADHY